MENGLSVYGVKVGVNVIVAESVRVGVGGGPNLMKGEDVGIRGVEEAKLLASEELHAEMEKSKRKMIHLFFMFHLFDVILILYSQNNSL